MGAVGRRVDEAIMHGVRYGAALGLAAMSSQMGEDFSSQPAGFAGGHPEDIEDIDERLGRYESHADAMAWAVDLQAVLDKLR